MLVLPWISEYFDDGGFPTSLRTATTEISLTILTGILVAVLQAQRRRIAQYAITDTLTGLFNSNHFSERFEHETGMARRFGASLAVIFLDLDNLKSVNDRYGHQTGSSLLAEFGGILGRHVRDKVDICFRFGGDEFVVVCPRADLAIAREIAQRIVEVGRLSPMKEKGATVSAGVASFRPEESAREFLRRADQALYEAKTNGKNRVETAP